MADKLFDTGEYQQGSPLTLNAAEIAALIADVGKPWFKRHGQARLVDAEYLRRGWHATLGAARKMTAVRFDTICQRLRDFTVIEIAWAARAYMEECTGNAWRTKNPSARLSFERFLEHDRFEVYVELGKALAKRKSQISTLKSEATTQRMRELGHWKTLDDDGRLRHLARARKMLRHQGPDDARVIALAQRYALEFKEGSQ